MTVNATKLGNALGNLAELKKLFAELATSLDPDAGRLRQALSRHHRHDARRRRRADDRAPKAWASSCSATRRTRTRCNVRLDGIEKRLRAQYTALDAKMAQLNSQSNYITQQIAACNATALSK